MVVEEVYVVKSKMAIYIPTQTLHSQFRKIMRKFIEISEEALERIESGMGVEGSMKKDLKTGKITFTAWKRRAPKYYKEKKVADLDNGWLGKTDLHYTEHLKFARSMGFSRIMDAMERNHRQAKDAMTDEEIINRV